jgi:tRNA nucleotidyltransferase/poly(A) polymerase
LLGEKHGTITARINDAVNFEVTTLRIDKVDQFGKYLIVELNVPDFLKGLGHQMD